MAVSLLPEHAKTQKGGLLRVFDCGGDLVSQLKIILLIDNSVF